MRKIFLHGALGETYGSEFELDVLTAGEAIRALSANFPAFMKDINEGAWHVVRGDLDNGLELDAADISTFKLGGGDLHIVPHVSGGKNGGLLKVVLGVVLIGAAFALTAGAGLASAIGTGALSGISGTQVALFGGALALAGVSSMLTPEQKDEEDKSDSFTSSGPGSTTGQGGALPLVYGEVITGAAMISGGIDIERIDVTGSGGGSFGAGGKK